MNKVLFIRLDNCLIEYKKIKVEDKEYTSWNFKSGVLSSLVNYVKDGYRICIVVKEERLDNGSAIPSDVFNEINNIKHNINIYNNLCNNQLNVNGLLFAGVIQDKEVEEVVVSSIASSKEDINLFFNTDYLSKKYEVDIKNSLYIGMYNGNLKVNRNNKSTMVEKKGDIFTILDSTGTVISFNRKQFKPPQVDGLRNAETLIMFDKIDNIYVYDRKNSFIYDTFKYESIEDITLAEKNKIEYIDIINFIK